MIQRMTNYGGGVFVGIIREQIKVIKEKDAAAKSSMEVLLYPSFWATILHRAAHWFYQKHCFFFARFISQFSRLLTGIEIHPGAKIGKRFFIDHGMGVVIGETCEIGDNVLIYQGVTLGGTGKDTGKRHPTVGNNVLIGSGAKVLGPLVIGNNSKVGAGSVVLHDVPPNTTVVGVPAKVAGGASSCPSDVIDQVQISDPVEMEFKTLVARLERLEKMMEEKNNFYLKKEKEA